MQALRFYSHQLQARNFKSWKKEILHNKKRHVRSKLYTIFSAWKFYIKERTLLKMYLRESNIMQDPDLMSTIELKDNYARISQPRSIFGESLSSETANTPFRTGSVLGGGDRNALNRIDGMILNMQSPQFNRGVSDSAKMIANDHGDELLQATGNFSSMGSQAGIKNAITQSSK